MNVPRSVVQQIDLQKEQLLKQIQQLQKELQKQQKKQQKQVSNKPPSSVKKQLKPTKSSLSPRDLSTMTKSNYRQSKPAISETWKNLFSVDPYLYQNKNSSYVISKNQEDYHNEIKDQEQEKNLNIEYLSESFFERYQDQ